MVIIYRSWRFRYFLLFIACSPPSRLTKCNWTICRNKQFKGINLWILDFPLSSQLASPKLSLCQLPTRESQPLPKLWCPSEQALYKNCCEQTMVDGTLEKAAIYPPLTKAELATFNNSLPHRTPYTTVFYMTFHIFIVLFSQVKIEVFLKKDHDAIFFFVTNR